METRPLNVRIPSSIYEGFKEKIASKKVKIYEVVSDLIEAWTANPDLLRDVALNADASALGVNSAQLGLRDPPSAAELEELADNPHLTLEELRTMNQEIASDRLLAKDLKEMGKVFGVSGSGEPNDPSPVAVDARNAKRRQIQREPIFVELASELPPDDSLGEIF